MPRYCASCGRDVHDPEQHELIRIPTKRGVVRSHACKNLALIAESSARDLVTGERRLLKRYVPETPQRTAANQARFVHRDALAALERD